MNKEKIKNPLEFARKGNWSEILSITNRTLKKIIFQFAKEYSNYVLESKREEIERKAYEAGHKNTFCSEYTGWDVELESTYDEWTESQKLKE